MTRMHHRLLRSRILLLSTTVLSLATAASSQTSDRDGDAIVDSADNCLTVPNGPAQAVGQLDADQDGIGNACDVDYDNSGTSTTLDFAIFLTALKGGPTSVTDHDGSGTTTLVDYATFLGQYGRVPGPSGLPCANPLLKVAAGDSPCVSDEDVLPVGVVMQNSQEALAADLARLADGKGMTLDEATNAIHFQESFVEYAKDIDVRFPDQISRIWMRKSPQRGGFIEFVGDVPPGNRPSGVTLLGDGVLTRSEHEMRAELAADALKAAGHVDFLTFFDMPRDVIQLEMVVPPGSTPPPVQDLVATVRAALAADQTLRPIARLVAPSDVDVRFLVRDGPIYEFEYARGGNWLQVDGFQSCTSGWVVDGPDGDGIITAAHCVGLNEFAHTGGAVYEIVWRDQELDKGDAEYHTTTGFSDLAEFYASDTEIRDVEELKETIWMLPGSDVCVYGRSSNVRDCTHEVEATGVTTVMNPGSITVRKLVRASGDSTIGGDSGGGWSWSTKAWGVHSGSNGTDSYFTPIHRAEDELNVDVMLAP